MPLADPQEQAPILVAFSPGSARPEPVEFGLAASRLTGAPMVAVTVQRAGALATRFAGPLDDRPAAPRTFEHMRLDLRRRSVDIEVRVAEARTVAGGLAEAIEELEPGLVVLGSTRRARAGSVLMGRVAKHVVNDAPCPVAIVPSGYEATQAGVQVLGAAFAPTTGGVSALSVAGALARAGGARLRAITVTDGVRPEADSELRAAVSEHAPGVAVEVDVIVHDDPARALVTASSDLDILVMGPRAGGGHRLGNVSRQVADRAGCPILTLPRSAAGNDSLLAHAEAYQAL
jgi:nucleotide-binding universal stress UspA family protein